MDPIKYRETVKNVMYEIFNETDAVRDKQISNMERMIEAVHVPATKLCILEGDLLWRRITEATSSEECRGYITELITVLSVYRTELDIASGVIPNGSRQEAEAD